MGRAVVAPDIGSAAAAALARGVRANAAGGRATYALHGGTAVIEGSPARADRIVLGGAALPTTGPRAAGIWPTQTSQQVQSQSGC